MTTETRRVDALQLIFSVFLGILLVVLIGVGVWTFYPDPYGQNSPAMEQMEELNKQMEQVNIASGKDEPTAVQQARMKKIQDEMDALNDQMSEGRDDWAVVTSVILLTFATILMAISLFLPDHMRVFSNGVLLGGLFTVIYGTGWSFAGGDSRARFFVVLVALLLTVLFGYLRFIRGRRAKEAAVAPVVAGSTPAVKGAVADAGALATLSARVDALESRAAAAAAALAPEDRREDRS